MAVHERDELEPVGKVESVNPDDSCSSTRPESVDEPLASPRGGSASDRSDVEHDKILSPDTTRVASDGQEDAIGAEQTANGETLELAPDDADAAAPELRDVASGRAADALEELTLPSTVQALEQLTPGTIIDPEGTIVIDELREQRGRVNRYRATRTGAGDPLEVDLIEAPADHPGVARTAEVLTQVQYSMLPRLHATWEADGKRFLATEPIVGSTLADSLATGMSVDEVISVTLQLAQALRRLQREGWSLVGLSPESIVTGQPIRITQLSTATRIGDTLASPYHVPGYSAPELVQPCTITGNEVVFTLGAILYHGLAGSRIPEQGPELAGLATAIPTPGVPQLLSSSLASADDRINLETFYTDLLTLRRRLTLAPIALRVASGTTIGLNATRAVNEDACGYLTWSSAWEGHVVWNAVLCAIDGMGGMEAGEVASTSALRAVLRDATVFATEQFRDAPGADVDTDADATESTGAARPSLDPRDLVQAAAEAAFTAARGRTVGATITCAVVEDGILRLGHVGDTRAYLLREGEFSQLTRDHSLVAAMVASGVLTADEARGHPESNKVLRSLGGMRSLPDEYVDTLAATSGQDTLTLQVDDQLLFCTDGIWGTIDDNGLREILLDSIDLDTAVQTAIDRALAAGAPDNAAIVVARCVEMPAS